MSHENVHRLLDSLIAGDISEQDHAALQEMFKHDADARAVFRERMDLEAGLRTWAAEPALFPTQAIAKPWVTNRWFYPALGIAAALLLIIGLLGWKQFFDTTPNQVANQRDKGTISTPSATTNFVGYLQQRKDCEWRVQPVSASGRFAVGKLELVSGIAELRFDSGTDITLTGPCELDIASIDSALLIAGDVCVNVGELSNGFSLNTPESRIIDEGTEYAVSLTSESTEVHVFDGSVIWIPENAGAENKTSDFTDRIEAGEARSYSRSEPTKPQRIPFGQRQFVRRLEDAVKDTGGKALFVYDGFENLAGRVRRGRSGFGWSEGWQAGGRGRGKLGEIIDCPDDVVFGLERSQRRMMLLEQGTDIRRDFDQPLNLIAGEDIYVGVLFARQTATSETDGLSLQISLEPDLAGRGRRLHQVVSFGVATDGFPYIRSANRITKTASKLDDNQTVFCVLKLNVGEVATTPSLRVYRSHEIIDKAEPSAWTVTGKPGSLAYSPSSIRITAGENTAWQIDELKIGKTWQSIQPGIE